KLKDIPLSAKRQKLKKLLWLVSIARNALVVLAASAVAFCTHDADAPLFKLSGKVESGLPKFGLPPFSTTLGNQTVGFVEMVERLGSGLAVLPFVMVLANIAIAKAFSEYCFIRQNLEDDATVTFL
ncbi:jg26249, partial [Pararge aegeria aegeria]